MLRTKKLTILAFIAVMVGLISLGGGTARAGGPWYVSLLGNDGNDCLSAGTACLTINGAIGKASPSDTIKVAAGIYDEQVVINKSLTLQGAGSKTIIKPSSAAKLTTVLSGVYGGGTIQVAAIVVANVADGTPVTLKKLKVDGENITAQPTGANYVAGIFYGETGGTVDTVSVVNMTVGVTGDAVRGYGFYLSAVTNTVSVEIEKSDISKYDKNGINAHGDHLTANIHHNVLIGRGPLPVGDEVQNGVLITDGAVGTINANLIKNMAYISEEWWSTGILFVGGDGTAKGNVITDCQIGVLYQDGDGVAEDNIVSGGSVGRVGLWAQYTVLGSWEVTFEGNKVTGIDDSNPTTGLVSHYDTGAIGAQSWNAGVSLALSIEDNWLMGNGTTKADGIYIGDILAYGPAGSITSTITGNTISKWENGIHLVSSVAAGSTITGNTITNNVGDGSGIHIEAAVDATQVEVHFNNIDGNETYGIYNGNAGLLDAEKNWWGSPKGPSLDSTVCRGDKVSDNVDFTPWLTRPYQYRHIGPPKPWWPKPHPRWPHHPHHHGPWLH